MELIRTFGGLGKGDAGLAGGKGASLGEMTTAGIPVPPGFVVLAGAFEQFLHETDLLQEIDAILGTVSQKEMHTVEHASEKIQGLILAAAMPEDIRFGILQNYKILDAEFVAVRSSATAEDSASAAWAGQLDSFLNTDEANLLKNVQRCWASLFTPRAIFYRFEKELHLTKISVAVVVQKMVESEVSGIAFSVHPVTEDYNQLIIEAGFGLGEAIVSGQVTPDSYVVEKEPRRILDINTSSQTRALYRSKSSPQADAEHANEWRDIPEPKASSQVLTEAQILELSDIILTIENHYGFPCDIEWAFEKGKFYIVQSRPITTLAPLSSRVESLDFLKQEDFNYVGLYKCSPFSLWYWSAWYDQTLADELGVAHETDLYFGLKGGHTFARKTGEAAFRKVVQERVEAGDVAYFSRLCDVLEREAMKAEEFGRTLSSDLQPEQFKTLVEYGRRLVFFCFVAWQNSQQFDPIFKSAARSIGIPEHNLGNYIPAPHTKLTEQHEDALRLKQLLVEKDIWELLKQNAPQAIEAIKHDTTLWPLFESHLLEFKWLNLMNWVGEPLSLEKLLEQMTLMQPLQHSAVHAPEALSTYIEVAGKIAHLRNAGVEHMSIFMDQAMPALQALAARMGLSYQDFILLTPPEVFEGDVFAVGYKERTLKRQNDTWCIYHDEVSKTIKVTDDPAVVETVALRFMPAPNAIDSGNLKGQIGNKGKATGPVRVIIATDDFHKMQEGDVLVTPMTTPDFVLLMQKSAAIVTDMGGLLCHAAIVSRELNKPCVIDTKFATQVLHDGDLVEVDADLGIVRILEKSNETTT